MRGRGGFTLVEIIVALGVSSLLMLGIASLSVQFFRGHVQMDQETALHTLKQLLILATTPGGATLSGQDSCDQTFAGRTIQWTPTSLTFDISSTPLLIRFAGDTLVRGPQVGLPDVPFHTWRATYLAVDQLKCRTLPTTGAPVDCLGGASPPNERTEFFGQLTLRVAPMGNQAALNPSISKTIQIPVRLFANAPSPGSPFYYTTTGCNAVTSSVTDENACFRACLVGFITESNSPSSVVPAIDPNECWDTATNTCYLTRRQCQALGVDLAVNPSPTTPIQDWRCNLAQLKKQMFDPSNSNSPCDVGPPPQYMQGFTTPGSGATTNFVCQTNSPPSPANYCENCVKAAPLVGTSPSQQACNPGLLPTATGTMIFHRAWVRFGPASGAANVVESACDFAPVGDPPVSLCSGSCSHGVL